MSRRTANVAGLAALAALGYSLYNKGKDKSSPAEAPKASAPAAKKEADADEPYMTSPRGRQGGGESAPPLWSRRSLPGRRLRSRDPSDKDMRGTSEAASLAKNYKPRRAPDQGAELLSRNYKPRYSPTKAEQDMAEAEAYARSPKGRSERQTQIEGQALERVTPESQLIGGPGLKAVSEAARALAAGKAATSAGRSLATREPEELVFLGRSGARRMTEPERLGAEAARIGREPAKIGYKKGGAVRSSPAPKQESTAGKGWGQARGARKAKIY